MSFKAKAAPALLFFMIFAAFGSLSQSARAASIDQYNVKWTTLGKNYNDSMPIGNGDIGLNIWTEQNGDIVFLIGKTDAYSENDELLKLGRVRIRFTPNPFTPPATFSQILDLGDGEIVLRGGVPGAVPTTLRVWVDANRPVIHIDGRSGQPLTMQASVELWRTQPRLVAQNSAELGGIGALRELNNSPIPVIIDPDTVLPARDNQLAWCHFNSRSTYPEVMENQHLQSLMSQFPDPLLHRTFGAVMLGAGLVSAGPQMLQSANPQKDFHLAITCLTTTASSPRQWRADIAKVVAQAQKTPRSAALTETMRWWHQYWNRSWIYVSGTPNAVAVGQSYAMQRWMDACGGRGSIPIKYNGSIFTVGQEPPPGTPYLPAKGEQNADFRAWGGNFWAQNQRQVYWPMIASGDFDLLAPYLKMYRNDLPMEEARNEAYFHQPGAVYPETMYFWGTPNNNDFGWGNKSDIMTNPWIRYHTLGSIEAVDIMLTEYDYTENAQFAKNTLLPVAVAVTTYYNNHWPRAANGQIHMDPSQAIETYQTATNPTPDIAGLMNILPRLIALPPAMTTATDRSMWKEMLAELPPIPIGRTAPNGKMPNSGANNPDGLPTILPAQTYTQANNVENPELYTVFPFHLYGVGLPDLQLARNTFAARRFLSSTCWGQDGEEAALLGLTDAAKQNVIANFTAYGGQRFPWFWRQGHDWSPDMDNGGAGMSILQLMLVQNIGRKILLLPTWPANWNADFKLYAPYRTIIQGVVQAGKLTSLTVTPESRRKDVILPP